MNNRMKFQNNYYKLSKKLSNDKIENQCTLCELKNRISNDIGKNICAGSPNHPDNKEYEKVAINLKPKKCYDNKYWIHVNLLKKYKPKQLKL